MHESTLAVGGAVVFWTAATATARVKLFHALAPLGLARLVPDLRAPTAALEEVFGGPRTLVRPLADRDRFADRLGAKGKVAEVTLVAVARELVVMLNATFRGLNADRKHPGIARRPTRSLSSAGIPAHPDTPDS